MEKYFGEYDDLDLDSLDLVELAIAKEEEFGEGPDEGGNVGDREPREPKPYIGSGSMSLNQPNS